MNTTNKNGGCQFLFFILITLIALIQGCSSISNSKEDFYKLEDFSSVKKIDAHAHVQTTKHALMEQAKTDNFVLISLNCEVPGYPPIDSQQYYAGQQKLAYPDDFFLPDYL